jgi:PAS domain S-box-containing protein
LDPHALPGAESLFEEAPCGLVLTLGDGTICRANATFLRWTGYRADDLVGTRRLQDLLTIGGRVFHQTHWAPLLQMQGSVAEVKLDIVHRDGHTLPMLVNAIRRRHGGVVHQEISFMVVADRHKYERELLLARKNAESALVAQQAAQRALQESRDVLSLAMRGARMAIWSRDLTTGAFWWSRELEELVGMSRDEVEQAGLDFFSLVHAQDRPALLDALTRSQTSGTDYTTEFRLRDASGEWRWMEGRGRAMPDAQGNALTLYGLVIDINERKDAQTAMLRQAAIFEHQSDAIIITTPDGHIVDFNPGCERMVGYRVRQAVGKSAAILLGHEYAESVLCDVRRHIRAEGEWRGELVFVRADGDQGICECVVKPLANARGETYGAVAICRDITERRRTDAELRRLNQQLSEADRRKDEFLATLAHELRNPLAPMRNVLGILEVKDIADPQVKWARDVLARQLGHMTHLVDDLLDVSRIANGKVELRRELLDLDSVIRTTVETARPLIDSASHELTVEPADEPVMVDADPTRLTQILLNLLNNAAKYTPPGGRIRIRATRKGGEAVISVRDSGIGIPREQLGHVFEMFSQLAPALDRSQGGLGIGLALVRGLVELHGGSVSAHSDGPGKGSEFVVHLPVSADTPVASAAPRAACTSQGCKVLVVDDNADAATSLAMVLTLNGHEVTVANDGPEALEQAPAFQPDVVLLDIGLPGLNGYQVAQRLREAPWGRGMLLVAVTGWGQDADRLAAAEAGFDRHLTKPVDLSALLALLQDRADR